MTTDELLRKWNYRIVSRPEKGEAMWKLGTTNIIHSQSAALARIREYEKKIKK